MTRQTAKPLHKIVLYQFKNFDMARFIDLYLREINPHEDIDPETLSVYHPAQTIITKERRGARSTNIIENKCRYLQDAIIRSANSEKDTNTFSLNSELLRSVIGKDYKPMLEVLTRMEYIELGDGTEGTNYASYYEIGVHSTIYSMKDKPIEKTKPFINQAIQAYKEKTEAGVSALKDRVKAQMVSLYGGSFLQRYLISLNYIKVEDEAGLAGAVKAKLEANPNAEPYYRYVLNELHSKNKVIYKIDDSHRVYHILTNLDRDLKEFLSIDFSLDSKNSHPLLFNYFIFNKLNISNISSYNISSSLKDIYPISNTSINVEYHNVGQYLRNILIDSDIEIESVARMADDELEYVYMTSNGLLWDEICERHPDLDRSEVKRTMFASVFYSNSPVPDRWNEYAQEFKQRFPTVFKLIGDWKRQRMQNEVFGYMREHRLPTDKGTASLSVAMMGLEAEIFSTILTKLYQRRWNALHIHDCIIIPKDGNLNHPTIEQVREVMEGVYREFGLCPTFD